MYNIVLKEKYDKSKRVQRVREYVYLCVYFFEVGLHVYQAGLRLSMQLKVHHVSDPPAFMSPVLRLLYVLLGTEHEGVCMPDNYCNSYKIHSKLSMWF